MEREKKSALWPANVLFITHKPIFRVFGGSRTRDLSPFSSFLTKRSRFLARIFFTFTVSKVHHRNFPNDQFKRSRKAQVEAQPSKEDRKEPTFRDQGRGQAEYPFIGLLGFLFPQLSHISFRSSLGFGFGVLFIFILRYSYHTKNGRNKNIKRHAKPGRIKGKQVFCGFRARALLGRLDQGEIQNPREHPSAQKPATSHYYLLK